MILRVRRMNPLRIAAALIAFTLLSHVVVGQGPAPTPETLPILGIAGITFRVSNLERARRYYEGVLGLPEAFTLKDEIGRAHV